MIENPTEVEKILYPYEKDGKWYDYDVNASSAFTAAAEEVIDECFIDLIAEIKKEMYGK